METRIITEAASPWRYEVCPYSDTVDLLTVGGIRLKGQWQGKLGEQYMAWMPLPKRDKQKELALGLGMEYLPEGFVPPVKKGEIRQRPHWIWHVIVILVLVYVVFPAVTFLLAPFLGLLMAGIVAVSLVSICLILLVATQCNSWRNVWNYE